MLQTTNLFLGRLSEGFFSYLGRLVGRLAPLARGLFGAWRPPGWLRLLGALLAFSWGEIQKRLGLVLIVLVLGLAVWTIWPLAQKWSRGVIPQPAEVFTSKGSLADPRRTEVENGGAPNPAVINFSRSTAPLALA